MDILAFWSEWWWAVVGIWGLTWIVLGYGVGIRQQRAEVGGLMGLFLGPLGVAFVYALGESDTESARKREAGRVEAERFAADQAQRKK